MTGPRLRTVGLAAWLLALGGCGGEAEPEGGATPRAPATPVAYHREYLFLGAQGGAPVVSPFSFVAVDEGEQLTRAAHVWVARGPEWNEVLEKRWRTPRATGVWKLLPRDELRLAVGGTTEVQAVWYRDDERQLRLELEQPASAWERAGDARFRVLRARLALGDGPIGGTVLETLEVERTGRAAVPRREWLLLAAGDSLRLVLFSRRPAEGGTARGGAWSLGPQGERAWSRAEVQWTAAQSHPRARRDIPSGWRFTIPEAGITGEVRAVGWEVQVGGARGGRRSLQARYTVRGWVEADGHRTPVHGAVRHAQE